MQNMKLIVKVLIYYYKLSQFNQLNIFAYVYSIRLVSSIEAVLPFGPMWVALASGGHKRACCSPLRDQILFRIAIATSGTEGRAVRGEGRVRCGRSVMQARVSAR